MDVKLNGIEQLQLKLKRNVTLEDVKRVVQTNGDQLNKRMKEQTHDSFKKGYSLGDTARSINTVMSRGGLTATVKPTMDYDAYVEFGTRFMDAEPFVKPAFDTQKQKFISDLKKLCR